MNFEEFEKLEKNSGVGSEMFELIKTLFPADSRRTQVHTRGVRSP